MSATRVQTRMFMNGWCAALVGAVVVVSAGGVTAQVPQLAIGNASGAPGGQATVTVTLNSAGESAATAQLDVLFDQSVLSIADPVSACVKDAGLTAHVLNPTLPGSPPAPEGQKRLRLAILDVMPPIAALPDGNLVTCTFDITPQAPLGDLTLTADRLNVGDPNGMVLCGAGSKPPVECEGLNGVVSVAFPTQTPTSTETGVPPTSTRTQTLTPVPPTPTRTNTLTPVPHTATATVTKTNTASPTKTQSSGGGGGGGCSIAPTSETSPTGILLLFAGSLLLVWVRRRHR
jgi:hypothetical protein